MATVRNYRELTAWKKAFALVREVYCLTNCLPKDEVFGLRSQLRRAAVSIPSNIAEGQGRCSTGEFRQFLGHARGSLFEVETQILLAEDLNYIEPQHARRVLESVSEVARILNGLMASLN